MVELSSTKDRETCIVKSEQYHSVMWIRTLIVQMKPWKTIYFFEIKGRSTVTSYKKRKHSYIMRRNEHHHHTNNARKQRTQQNTTPQTGRGSERSRRELRRRRQRRATTRAAARCKPEQLPELLHHGTITLKPHEHDHRSLCSSGASAKHSRCSTNDHH